MKKIVRDLSTEQSRSFWAGAEEASKEVITWPDWKRAGINTAQVRPEPRDIPETESPDKPIS